MKNKQNNNIDIDISDVFTPQINKKLYGVDSKPKYKKSKQIKKNKKINSLESYFIDNSNKPFRKNIVVSRPMTILELSKNISVKASLLCEYINKIKLYPNIIDINYQLEIEEIKLILEELGCKIQIKNNNISIKDMILNFKNDIYSSLKKKVKIPVVSIMGHVDHGKTTLLDYIRSSNIADLEKGNITQNIGAYYVKTEKGNITFLDTPGHKIFNLMRGRGIKLSDIIILIIAANDGIKPQTIEVIEQAFKMKIPIIVAINKIELVDTNITQSIITELLKYNIVDETLGGDNFIIPISAKTGQGVSKLLDTVILQRDILELKSSNEGMVIATVIESSVDKHLGPLATILIENGTLHKGDIVVCGNTYGKIRKIIDYSLNKIQTGYTSIPIQILGLSELPHVGDKLITVDSEKVAKEIISFQKKEFKLNNLLNNNKKNYDNSSFNNNLKHINFIIKSSSYGTLEVILNYLDSLNNKYKDKILLKVIHRGIGDINETDVLLAANTKTNLIGFNVGIDTHVKPIIRQRKLDVKIYNIIYHLMKDINKEFIQPLNIDQEDSKNILGIAIVKTIFHQNTNTIKVDNVILGCKINVGFFKKDSLIEIYREDRLIYQGFLETLRRFKSDVNEVKAPMECGLSIKNIKDITIGDIVKSVKEFVKKEK